jgi:RNA polymerase sigma-70 factor (ECF subfamily)
VAEGEAGALLRAAQGGDEDALDVLLKRYQPQIFRFGLKMCRDPEDAREVLQDTLFAAARTLHGFRGASSISTWLYTIARSFCIKKRRRGVLAPEVVSLRGIRSSWPGVAPDASAGSRSWLALAGP